MGAKQAYYGLLIELGWTKYRLAQDIGVHKETVYRWKEPPVVVLRYLETLVELKRLKLHLKQMSEE